MLSYVLRKIQSDILGVGGATIFEVKSVTIIPSLPYSWKISFATIPIQNMQLNIMVCSYFSVISIFM
jgi:hypothetical protein